MATGVLSLNLFLGLNSKGKNLPLLFSEFCVPSLRLGRESSSCLIRGDKMTENNWYPNPSRLNVGNYHRDTGVPGFQKCEGDYPCIPQTEGST